MVVDLPAARVCRKRAPVHASLRNRASMTSLPAMVGGPAEEAPEHEWRLTMALALEQLPSGACLVVRGADGREWFISPAGQAASHTLRKVA
jgi:hypothetical protein